MSNPMRKPDVLVVGGGLSGICAAIEAAESGASVTVLDRAHGGGASAISGGIVYAGGGTKYQREAGHSDDPENMFRYLQHEVSGAVDDTTLRRFCDQSVANLDWLESHGAKFSGAEVPWKTSVPTGDYYLLYSGNEKSCVKLAKPVPRGHRTVGKGLPGLEMTGASLWEAMFDSAVRLGVKFELASRVDQLLMDSNGQVKGVQYRTIDIGTSWATASYRWLAATAKGFQVSFPPLAGSMNYLADTLWDRAAVQKTLDADAIILAAGGFVMNRAMVDALVPWGKYTFPLGTAGDDGSGIKLGQSVGGRVSHMNRMSAWRFIYPPEALIEGIVVSAAGARIAAEDMYGALLADVMLQHHGGHGFLILDSLQWDKHKTQIEEQTQGVLKSMAKFTKSWGHYRQPTLESLAQKLQLDPARVKATVEAYNDAIMNGRSDPVGKLDHRSVIATGPFYAINVSISEKGGLTAPALTLGGLEVDGESGLVLDEGGKKITRLYAAGRNAVGLCSENYVSGLSLADCVFSGRRAGGHAANGRSNSS